MLFLFIFLFLLVVNIIELLNILLNNCCIWFLNDIFKMVKYLLFWNIYIKCILKLILINFMKCLIKSLWFW